MVRQVKVITLILMAWLLILMLWLGYQSRPRTWAWEWAVLTIPHGNCTAKWFLPQTEKCVTYTLPLWVDLGHYSQTTVNMHCQPLCSLRKEVCDLIKGRRIWEEKGDLHYSIQCLTRLWHSSGWEATACAPFVVAKEEPTIFLRSKSSFLRFRRQDCGLEAW